MSSLEAVLYQVFIGLYRGSYYWLMASGLSLIFGVTRVVNFAHAAFFVLGSYLAITFEAYTGYFWLSLAIATLLTGLAGLVSERLLVKPLYKVETIYQLLMTFAASLIINDVAKLVWGTTPLSARVPPEMRASFLLGDRTVLIYIPFVLVAGLLSLLLLYYLISRTLWGLKVRATWRDVNMAESLRINTQAVYSLTFFVGTALAGLGGGLMVPMIPVGPGLSDNLIVTAFIVVVIAGLGSFVGTYISALLIGVAESVLVLFLPEADIVLIYALMAAVLLVRPWGLFGEK